MTLDETTVTALPRKAVEQILLGMCDPLDDQLVKLVGFEFSPGLRRRFRRELRAGLRKIERLRFKPGNRTGSSKFYFNLLFDYPFGGVEVRNMRLIMDDIADESETARPTQSPEEMVARPRGFHTRPAERLHEGEDVLDLIPE
jgi:hypothetical protein